MTEHHRTALDAAPGEAGTGTPLEAVQHPASRRRRGTGPVDAAMGVGHPQMSADYIARSLARIAAKGVRTAKVQTVGGMPVVMTKNLPVGVHAIMLADRIEAVRTETGAVVASVAREATTAGAGGHVLGDREEPVRLASPAMRAATGPCVPDAEGLAST